MNRSFKFIIYAFSCAFLIGLSTEAISQTENDLNKLSPITFDPAVKVGKLPNGFTYYIRKNQEPKNRAQLYLATKVGSILENDDQLGLAHFVEHMGFNGTKHFPKNDLVSYLQKAGVRFGADLNAYTGFDETVYQLPIPTDDAQIFLSGIQIMRDWAQDATLDPEEINKERGVVLEEKRLGKGAQERMQNNYLPLIFNRSRYADRLPIGTEAIIKNFDQQTIQEFYNDWYRPNLQALIVVGDIDVTSVERMIKEKFSDLKNPLHPRPRTAYHIPLLNKNQFMVVTDAEFPSTEAHILIKHPETITKNAADLRNKLIEGLYNQMLSSRFSELSKQADPPFLYAGSSISGFMAGLSVASSSVMSKPGELEKGFKATLTEVERVKRFGFTDTELARAKIEYLTQQESVYKEREKTESEIFVNQYLAHFLKGQACPSISFNYNFTKKELNGIALSEVNEIAKKYISDTNRDILILGPEQDRDKMPHEALVNSWISEVAQSPINAYIDLVSNKPLLEKIPQPGHIISEKSDKDLGITTIVLSNGLKVILKPTKFKNDQISFQAFSPGGTSLYSDADFESANNAASIVSQSGIGEFDAIALSKYLTGKRLFVQPFIAERSEGITGNTVPSDLETALQLTHLCFTKPRKDQEIFKGYITQMKGSLANREKEPYSVFADSVAAILSRYNVRRTGPSIQKVDQIDLDKAYAIYQERFADASDFTFTFVGTFDAQKIKPLLETYLGSLPNLSRLENGRDLEIVPPSGKIDKQIHKGKEPKAIVDLIFTGDYNYGSLNNTQLNALAEVLSIKLIERLREEESGVYGVQANASYHKYPQARYSFDISFGCAPENVEKLTASALDEIAKIKVHGAQILDVEKFQAEERRTTETQLKDNTFWLNYLSSQLENQEDLKLILGYLDSLKDISPESLKEAANFYLSGENQIRFVLLPENSSKMN